MTLGTVSASRRRSTVVASSIVIASSAYSTINNSRSPSLTFTGWTPALNDLVIMFPRDASPDSTLTIPGGWVNPLGGTTKITTDSNQSAVLYHFVTAGEVSAVTTTYSPTNLFSFAIFGSVVGSVLRGVDTTTPVDSVATTFDSSDTATPHVIPALTGANLSTGSLVLGATSRDGDGAYGSGPGGWTQITKTADWSPTWYGNLNAATTAGVDVPAATITPNAGDEYTGISIALTAL